MAIEKSLPQKEMELADFLSENIFHEQLKRLSWSGRYEYTSWKKVSYQRALALDKNIAQKRLIQVTPSYKINQPLLKDPEIIEFSPKTLTTIKLHIDVDSTDPLDVVSGTVNRWSLFFPVMSPSTAHFIGQVVSSTTTFVSRQLVVEGFSFTWPRTTKVVDRLEISLTSIFNPVANATFICTADSTNYGPYEIPRISRYFREVEFEIDREDHARTVEPYNTHTHPDRPADLPENNLTLKTAYARAGIKVDYSDEANIISTTGSGEGGWTNAELHQAMEDHWSAYADKPQWKLWVFLGEHHASSGTAGIMFDNQTNLPGNVTDRQGTAIFTESDWLFGATGDFASDNTSPAEAVQRELFFTTVHEIGHAFNLAHSWQKTLAAPYGFPWTPPDWAPVMTDDNQGLSWMNYTWRADEDPVNTYCAKWFYDRFRFRFLDSENLFLRHAPEEYVQMGNETWFENHGIADASRLNRALSLEIRSRRDALELGEAVFVELRLKNVSKKNILTNGSLDPAAGFMQIAVTDPDGIKLPFLPPIHVDQNCAPTTMAPGEAIYESIQLTVGKMGFYFRKPGPYRVEACFTNFDGRQSSAVSQIWVKPASFEDQRIISTLYDGRVARAIYFGGARKMEDVNDKLDWMLKKLPSQHPARVHLASCLAMPLAKNWKSLPAGAKKVDILEADHSRAENILSSEIEDLKQFTDTLGHIKAQEIADLYVNSAVQAGKTAKAVEIKKNLLAIFKERKVVAPVLKRMETDLKKLK